MAKNMQPIVKRCRALGISPAVLGYTENSKRESIRNPGAQRITGEIMLQELERRLDNVVFRMGLAATRREARQLVNHGHFTINGKRVDIPSYLVKPGEVIAVCEKSRSTNRFKMLNEGSAVHSTPKWIEKAGTFEGKIIAKPVRDDIDFDVAEHLIVELYSK